MPPMKRKMNPLVPNCFFLRFFWPVFFIAGTTAGFYRLGLFIVLGVFSLCDRFFPGVFKDHRCLELIGVRIMGLLDDLNDLKPGFFFEDLLGDGYGFFAVAAYKFFADRPVSVPLYLDFICRLF